jgi:hypothetical protein
MDASALSDVQCVSGRQRRVGLAPQWQVPSLRFDDASDGYAGQASPCVLAWLRHAKPAGRSVVPLA